ncbi:MAG: hypothetical protein WCA13_06985 [Terriglobales bacterium]
MDPLITNGIDPALLRVLEKRGQERDPTPRRKRPAVPEKPAEEGEENNQEPGPDTPKHTLDDLA